VTERFVYLHGFASGPGSGKACWFRERFAELGLELLVPDLAGEDFTQLTLTGQLAVIGSVVEGAQAALIGSSLGGYLAALYAARHANVRRVALLAPAFGFAHRWAGSLGPERVAAWRAAGTLPVFHYARNETVPLGYGLLEDALRYEEEPAVSQPTLIVHGAQDNVVPPEASRRFAAGRANVELHVLEDGHELGGVLEPTWALLRPFLHL
jgi:pimeloyl-ACP methyl ester carboxylesterase